MTSSDFQQEMIRLAQNPPKPPEGSVPCPNCVRGWCWDGSGFRLKCSMCEGSGRMYMTTRPAARYADEEKEQQGGSDDG